MKNAKKIIALLLVIALTAAVAIGGTLAYLTDRESEPNVFTVGDVKIQLEETFEQGSELIPGVDINKDVQITNTGKNDAWVWYTYAVPTTLVDTGNNASKNAIHFNLESDYWDTYASDEQKATGKTWHWEDIVHNVAIDDSGVPYTVVTVLYNTTLAVGETTPVSLTNVYLDTRVDIDPDGNMAWVENGVATDLGWNINTDGAPVIYVNAYAIQAEGFTTVNEAYAAYNKQWGDNGSETPDVPTLVSTEEELAEALIAGESVALTADITVTKGISVPSGTEVVIDGNGKTVTTSMADGTWLYTYGGSNLDISDLTIKGEVKFAIYNQGGNVTMDNVTVEVDGDYVLCMYGGGNVELNNCTVSGIAPNKTSVWFGDGRTVTINGGSYSSVTINASKGAGIVSAGTLVLNNASVGKVRVGAVEKDGTVVRANLINNGSTIEVIDYEK